MGLCKDLWKKYNPFDIGKHVCVLTENLEDVKTSIKNIDDKLNDEVDQIEFELAFNKGLLNILAETIPDMLWLKSVDGVYLYANGRIRDDLLFCNPIGKTDIECAIHAKQLFGDENHQFGGICSNSDTIVQGTLKPQRFMESGKVKGKMKYLEVFKAPFYINGVLIGICGVGRDMTPYVEAYNANGCNKCIKPSDDIFKMYEFKNNNV